MTIDRIDQIRNDFYAKVEREERAKAFKECMRHIGKWILCWHKYEGTRTPGKRKCFKCNTYALLW